MTGQSQKRGPVGLAAEALKEALVAKLQPGVRASPINDGIFQAIKVVEGFLNSRSEDLAELESLKLQIKRVMMSQITARALASSQRRSHSAAIPAKQSAISSTTITTPNESRLSGVVGIAEPRRAGGGADGGGAPADGPPGGGAAPRVSLYSRASARSAEAESLDWTLPQHTLNRKAFVRGGEFGRMTLVQDELARRAEAARAAEDLERKRATAAIAAEQMEIVRQRKEAEQEARRLAQLEMDEHLRQYQLSEEARMKAHKEMQASLRDFYAGQVQDLQNRKRHEAEQRMRDHEEERARLMEEERKERARQEQLARQNAAQREKIKAALETALEEKAAAKAAQLEEETRYNQKLMAKMDADEAERRRAVAMRQEKVRLAFERSGGAALQASFEEQMRADAARAERLAAELEAATLERERREADRRRKAADDALRELADQVAAREAQRRAEAEAAERLKREVREAEEARRRDMAAAKAARRKVQAETRAAQRAAAIEQHRRRYHEYREPFEDRYRWLHAGPLSGTQRAFNNLAVPAEKVAVLASSQQ